jgi:hypothetical protein
LGWETHVDPDVASYPQEVVNRQIGGEYDVFLGLMWTRFGTPTAAAGSGTEEEFLQAFARIKSGENVKIKSYFKDKPVKANSLDLEQMAKVKAFRDSLAPNYGAYYRSFEDTLEFERFIRIDLMRLASDLPSSETLSSAPVATISTAIPPKDVLKNFHALTESEENEVGFLDALETSNNAMVDGGKVVARIAEVNRKFNDSINRATRQLVALKTLGAAPDPATVRIIIDSVTLEMNRFVEVLSKEVVSFHVAMFSFDSAFAVVIDFVTTNRENVSNEELLQQADVLEFYSNSVSGAMKQLAEFRDAVGSFPSISTALTSSKRKAVALLTDFLAVLDETSRKAGDAGSRLRNLAEQ